MYRASVSCFSHTQPHCTAHQPSGRTGATMRETQGQELPDGHQDDRADQRSENGDTIDVDITNPIDDNDLREQPDPNERRNDGPDEAEWQSPANKSLCDEADDRRNDQVDEKVEIERPNIVTQFQGDTV